jgi:hypothetical protein
VADDIRKSMIKKEKYANPFAWGFIFLFWLND